MIGSSPEKNDTNRPVLRLGRAAPPRPPPRVSDYELLGRIGSGSYGQVWLARSVMGTYRAVKVVYRDEFEDDRPFQREFDGIQRFEPISRLHESQVDILHVGRAHDCFYYVMELADDQVTGQQIEPDRYLPKTLRGEIQRRGALPFEEYVNIALALTTALEHLQSHNLVHRDIKPSNIIFVGGTPKLADIGLITGIDATHSYVGTEGYIPPEGPGTPQADLYSLGKVLYELSTGKDRMDFPDPPTLKEGSAEERAFLEFQEVLLKACEADPRRRYQTARGMRADLELLCAGQSLMRRRRREARFKAARRLCLVSAGAALALVVLYFAGVQRSRTAIFTRQQELERVRAEEKLQQLEDERIQERLETGDASAALADLAEALRHHPDNRVAAQRLVATLCNGSFALPRFPALRHGNPVSQIASSPDGRWLATADREGGFRLWEARTGRPASGLLKHKDAISDFIFSPDSRWLVTASLDHTARVWEAGTGTPLGFVLQHEGAIRRVQVSVDGQWIGTCSDDKTARVWDLLSGKMVVDPLPHNSGVTILAFSPVDRKLATGSQDGTIRIWDLGTGKCLQTVSHKGAIRDLEYSSDGERILTASEDGTAQVWTAATGEPLGGPLRHRGVEAMSHALISPDGDRIVTSSGNSARIWGARKDAMLAELLGRDSLVSAVNFSPDGERIVTGFDDGTVRVWNGVNGRPLTPPLQHPGAVRDSDFLSDGQAILTACVDGAARVWNVPTGLPVADRHYYNGPVRYAGFSPDGRKLLTASFDGAARILDARTGRLLVPPLWHRTLIYWAQFSPDGSRVVTASEDHTARLWDASTGRQTGKSLDHQNRVVMARFSPDGSLVATASWDHTARVWDSRTGNPLTARLSHSRGVRDVAFDPSGQRVVTACVDGTARIWSVRTGLAFGPPLRHKEAVCTARFSPDGKRVLTASFDGTAQLWDAATGHALAPPLKHADQVWSAEFSPNGELVVTASSDRTAQLWNSHTGQPVGQPLRHRYPARLARFSADGQRVVVAAQDTRVWDVRTSQALAEPLLHDGDVGYAEFSPDGQRVITASWDNTARLWEVPQVPLPVPEWLLRLVPAVTGLRANARGLPGPISMDELSSLQREAAGQSSDDFFTLFARWFFADPATRTISPDSCITFDDYVRGRLEENTLESLRQAARLAPRNGLVMARLARRLLDLDSADRLQPQEAEALSLQALTLAPQEPEVWWSRAAVLMREGKLPEAREALHRASIHPPANPEYWLVDGLVLEGGSDFEPAEQAFSKVIELSETETNWSWLPLQQALQHRANLRQRQNRTAEALRDTLRARGIPLRASATKRKLVDLSAYYNASLGQDWHGGPPGNNLSSLPCGVQRFNGIDFDVRGLIQLRSEPPARIDYPERVIGIKVDQRCTRMHFLQAAVSAASSAKGEEIGRYIVHYANGRQESILLLIGENVADWWKLDAPAPRVAAMAWTGANDASDQVGRGIQLFKSTWDNPAPDETVTSIDFLSAGKPAAPFLVALTLE